MTPAENVDESGDESDKVCDSKNVNPEEGQLLQGELFGSQILSCIKNARRNRVLQLAREMSGRKKPGPAVLAVADKCLTYIDSLDPVASDELPDPNQDNGKPF